MNKSQLIKTMGETTGPKPVFNAHSMYRSRGEFLRRNEQYDKAIDFFNEAHKSDTNDIRTLIGRSQTCSLAVRPEQAFEDADLAFSIEPKNPVTRCTLTHALFTKTNFERSLIMHHRGYQVRKQPPYFRQGIKQGLETLQDTVGINAGQMLQDNVALINQIEDKPAPEKSLRVSRIPKPQTKRKFTQSERRKLQLLSRVLANKYLGPMAFDKFFLENLLDDPRLESANAAGSRELKITVKEALNALNSRQELLRAQRPYYTVKLSEKTESKYMDRYNKHLLDKEREIGSNLAERMLASLTRCKKQKRIQDLVSQAERMQIFLDKKTLRTLPKKEMYTDHLYINLGEGYLSQYRLAFGQTEEGNRRRIHFIMGLSAKRPRSYDSVIANYPFKYYDIDRTIEKLTGDLELCENAHMRCWLYYELARLVCSQKNFALAKFYGKSCQREAEKMNCSIWWMNGCMVIVRSDMQQGNSNGVKAIAEEASTWLPKLPSHMKMQVKIFLDKCVEVTQVELPENEGKMIKQQELSILRTMQDPQRVEQQILFKRMSTVPSGRRFCVLPRPPEPFDVHSERRSRHQTGLTIVPGQNPTLRAPPHSDVLGFQTFDT